MKKLQIFVDLLTVDGFGVEYEASTKQDMLLGTLCGEIIRGNLRVHVRMKRCHCQRAW